MPTEFHIGIDDTDSPLAGCTTYTAAVLFQELLKKEMHPYDYPWLVRLNPNIPWKTRGNGALSIHLVVDESNIEAILGLAVKITEENAELSSSETDPAIAFLNGPIPSLLRDFSTSALNEVISFQRACKVAKKVGAQTRLLKGKRGLIGSMAAIGAGLDSTKNTFEIIAYRTKENLGTPRRVELQSVSFMNSRHHKTTFHNVDPTSGRILVCPHGPDPVLLGIRGTSPQNVLEAYRDVRIDEPVERIMIFRTNQGTDAHLTRKRCIIDLKPYQSAVLEGRVETVPRVLRGGHVLFQLSDCSGTIHCAVFARTGCLARAAREFLPGDHVRLYGGVRKQRTGPLTLNLEKMDVLTLVTDQVFLNPLCSSCGARCESMGRDQGIRCRKCGLRFETGTMICSTKSRALEQKTYKANVGARRHLSSPLPIEASA